MNMYKVMFCPIIIFGSESWVLTKKHHIRVAKLKDVKRRDRVRNIVVTQELKVESIETTIQFVWIFDEHG